MSKYDKVEELMNKCLALLRNVYDDDHGFKITVTEQNGNIYSKYYRMIDYLKAYKYFLSMHQIILF